MHVHVILTSNPLPPRIWSPTPQALRFRGRGEKLWITWRSTGYVNIETWPRLESTWQKRNSSQPPTFTPQQFINTNKLWITNSLFCFRVTMTTTCFLPTKYLRPFWLAWYVHRIHKAWLLWSFNLSPGGATKPLEVDEIGREIPFLP